MSVTQRRRLYCNRKRIVELFSGDCDDHSILMAASVRAIGGTPRLIHTKGHIYPEILIGTLNDLETVNYLIKNVLFEKESYKSNCTIILMNAVKFGLT
jgi:transglutaminase-like putative cysteine protease